MVQSSGMKNVIIVHGAFGLPDENWIPSVRSQLEERGYDVTVPTFPTPKGQNYENWMSVMQPHLDSIGPETILIGHSIGATFLLSVLEKIDVKVKKAILASGFVGPFEGDFADETFDKINKTIAERDFDWEKIKNSAVVFAVLHGVDDPYVPPEKPEFLSDKLGCAVEWIENGGHLNQSAGFTTFPRLLEIVLE